MLRQPTAMKHLNVAFAVFFPLRSVVSWLNVATSLAYSNIHTNYLNTLIRTLER